MCATCLVMQRQIRDIGPNTKCRAAASPATSPSPRPPSASLPEGRSRGTPKPSQSVTSARTTLLAARTVTVCPAAPEPLSRTLLLNSSLQDSVIPARMPRAQHRAHERADDPRPLRPSGNTYAFPDRRPDHRCPQHRF
jgi:hypothetical protein